MTEKKPIVLQLDTATARCIISAVTLASQVVTSKGMILYTLTHPDSLLAEAITSHLTALTGEERVDVNNYKAAVKNIEPKLLKLMELSLNILKQTEPEHSDEIEASLEYLRRGSLFGGG